MELNLKIEGLSCGHCVNAVDNILKDIDGIFDASVSLPDIAAISYDENKVTLAEIKKAINDSEIYKAL